MSMMMMTGSNAVESEDSSEIVPEIFGCCQLDGGYPCSECQKHIDLDAKILAAQRTLDELKKQQHLVHTKINRVHDPITRHFPPEVISTIFQFALPDSWHLNSAGADLFEEDFNWDGNYEEIKAADKVYGPLFLGAVCQAWRHVAWTTPSLWTGIRIFLQRKPTVVDLQIASQWLSRSGLAQPLWIRLSDISEEQSSLPPVNPFQRAIDYSFVALINRYASRWDILNIEGNYGIIQLLRPNLSSAPKLRLLSIHSAEQAGMFFGVMGEAKPQPREVWTRRSRLNALNIQWSHVTSVALQQIQLTECSMLLQSAPQLIHCYCTIKDEEPPISLIRNTPIVHHALQTMQFGCSFADLAEMSNWTIFFDSFNFPNLTRYDLVSIELQPFPSHLARSSCALTSLTIESTDLGYDLLLTILREVHSLLDLTIERLNFWHGESFDIKLLRLLGDTSLPSIPNSTAGGYSDRFLPNLRSFRFMPSGGLDLDWDVFWECISNVLGPIQQIHNPQRRPLDFIKVLWHYINRPMNLIKKETVLQLLQVEEAGVCFDLRENHIDLFSHSVIHHGIDSKGHSILDDDDVATL